jgi:hypothetical protein
MDRGMECAGRDGKLECGADSWLTSRQQPDHLMILVSYRMATVSDPTVKPILQFSVTLSFSFTRSHLTDAQVFVSSEDTVRAIDL